MSEEQHSVKTQRDQGMEELLANLAGADISNALTMPNSVAIEFHPYSRLFPLMEGCELAGLVADIQENGLRVPIVLLDNRILDGRNRYRACMEAGIRPVFEQYTGDDPLGNVLSANLHRRHLTESQIGMVASALATMRQGARTDIAQVCAMSQEQAAKRLAVSRRTVQYACTVREQGIPELVRRAERGEINVSLAARIAKMPQEQQRRVTALDLPALRGAVKQAVPADRKIAAPPFTPNTDDIASVLTRTDPLSLMKADPSDARLLGMNAAARRAAAGRGDGLLWPVSLFGERAVSSPRPTFQTARRAASVKRGAEQPGATRSAL